MMEIKQYHLPPTQRIPNSHFPLLHYRGALRPDKERIATEAYDLFAKNGWQVQWIFRYGNTQASHYHSRSHECMAVLTGSATIRFGVADTTDDLQKNTYDQGWEEGGVEVQAQAGDVFVIPAGVAHKTYATKPDAEFALLTPGRAVGVEAEDPREAVEEIELTGFTMLGAYPERAEWDFALETQDEGERWRIWSVPRPQRDPVLGSAGNGLCDTWTKEPAVPVRSRL